MGDKFLTVKEVAERWRMSEKRVYQLLNDPDDPLPFHELGGKKIKLKDVVEYEQRKRYPKGKLE